MEEKTYPIDPEKTRGLANREFIRLFLFIAPFFITLLYILYIKTQGNLYFSFIKQFPTYLFLALCAFVFLVFTGYIYYSVWSYFRYYKVEITEDYLLVPQMLRSRNGVPYYSITGIIRTPEQLIIQSEQRVLRIYTELEAMDEMERALRAKLPEIEVETIAHRNDTVYLLNLAAIVCLLLMVFVSKDTVVLVAGPVAGLCLVLGFVLAMKDKVSRLSTGKIIYCLPVLFAIIGLIVYYRLK